MPELLGQYIFGNAYISSILTLPANSEAEADSSILTSVAITLGSFAQNQVGEIYALDLCSTEIGGAIYRLMSNGASIAELAENLSETGCFNVTSKTAPEDVVSYQVNSQLRSDCGAKARFFCYPSQ
ncbi:MAG: hypothetical protein ACJAUP_001565 [Cellvibrionaceae bacterium]|jgi:hypothetical protein